MAFSYIKTAKIKELEGNPRTITKGSFKKLCKSIEDNTEYFEARPLILSNRTGELIVIAGNQRLKAARKLRIDKVPTYLLEGLTEEQEREIIIRDNVSNGDWDMDILANEWDIEQLKEWDVDFPTTWADDVASEQEPTERNQASIQISFDSLQYYNEVKNRVLELIEEFEGVSLD